MRVPVSFGLLPDRKLSELLHPVYHSPVIDCCLLLMVVTIGK